MPFQRLWPRALAATIIGGLAGWLCTVVWVQGLGRLFFPSAFQDPRVVALLSTGTTIPFGIDPCGAAIGLCLALEKGKHWAQTIATGLRIWLGTTFFLLPLLFIVCIIAFPYFGIRPQPSPPSTPPSLMTISPLLFAWWMVLWVCGGAFLLHRVYRLHLAGQKTQILQTTKEGIQAILQPRIHKQLDSIVLQSPFNPNECERRLTSIAEPVSNSLRDFWKTIPGLVKKPLWVRIKGDEWQINLHRKNYFNFYVKVTPLETGTQLSCDSRAPLFFTYYSAFCSMFLALITAVILLTSLSYGVAWVLGRSSSGSNPSVGNPAIALLFLAIMWTFEITLTRTIFWHAKRQEIFIVEQLKNTLEAVEVERQPKKLRFGFF